MALASTSNGVARCHRTRAFSGSSRSSTARPVRAVICRASAEQSRVASSKRDVLLAGAAAAAASLLPASPAAAAIKEMPVSSLSTFQKGAQRAAFAAAAEGVLRERFGADDASGLLALVLHDAATYDAATKTGGFDGSILTSSEELARPENAPLKPLAARLADAKAAVDAATPEGSGPISNADLLVLATKVATQAAWKAIKLKRTVTTSGGDIIATVYGTDWPVRLGRLDAPAPGPGRVPSADAPVPEIVAFMKQLGAKPVDNPGPFTPKPPFWERPTFVLWPAATADPAATEARFVAEVPDAFKGPKTDYDRSRTTLTRTEYEVDFINFFTRLTAVGATFDPNAYLHPEATLALKF